MSRVPKILHFCFFTSKDAPGRPFSLSNYVCVQSAIEKIKPDKILFYYEDEPDGPWWPKLRKIVEPIKVQAPREIFGRPIAHPAHRADVQRLRSLAEHGGIYLDVDVFVHKPFDQLLDYSTALGREGDVVHNKLCNAVIIAEPGAPFIRRWINEYRDFRGRGRTHYWNEHSVLRPAQLAANHPSEITILSDQAFFWPLFKPDDLARIFASSESIVSEETFATHLWEGIAWYKYLELLTPGKLRRQTSNFAKWALPYLEGIPDDFGAPDLNKRFRHVTGQLRHEYGELKARAINRLHLLRRSSPGA